MKLKLTQAIIDKLPAATGERYFVDDEIQRGLQLSVSPKSVKTWHVFYRIDGQRRRPSIGRYPELTLQRARIKANKILVGAQEGEDFSLERQGVRQNATLEEFCTELFLPDAKVRMRARSYEEHVRRLDLHIYPRLGNRRLNQISVSDVKRLHDSMADRKVGANRCLELLRLIFNKAKQWKCLPMDHENPALSVDRFTEDSREKYLSTEELKRLADTLDKAETEGTEPIHAIEAIRLLLLTGCRKNEILQLAWNDIDEEHKAIMLPDAKSKTGKRLVPLSEPAMEAIERLKKIRTEGNGFVIEGHCHGKALVGLQRIWNRIRTAANVPDCRVHDLRHTHASMAAWSGISLPLIGGILGHRQPQTTNRYSHLSNSVLHAASDQVGAAIVRAMKGEIKKAAVVEIERAEAEGDQKADGGM